MLDSIKAGIVLSFLLLLTACSDNLSYGEIKGIFTFQLYNYVAYYSNYWQRPGENATVIINKFGRSPKTEKICVLDKDTGNYFCMIDISWTVYETATGRIFGTYELEGCNMSITPQELEYFKRKLNPLDSTDRAYFQDLMCLHAFIDGQIRSRK